MDIRNFYILLKKHRVGLLLLPLMAMAVTTALVRNKPDSYRSEIQIATGIVDQSQSIAANDDGAGEDSKIDGKFANLIETIKLNQVVDQVSFRLLLHDLTEPYPYKAKPAQTYIAPLDANFKSEAVVILNQKLDSFTTLDLNIPQERMIDSLLIKMEYDHESLLKNITAYRAENSDFIDLDVDAENPTLSAFIANNLTDRFFSYYSNYINSGYNRSADFFAKLLEEKKNAMDQKSAELEAFKIKNGVLDVDNESKDVYTQLSNLESERDLAEKDVIADSGALKSIDVKFTPGDRQYAEANTSKINVKILSTKERLKVLNDKYIQSNFDPHYKKSIDSLQDVLTSQITESSDNSAASPLASKDNIVLERLKTENDLELARYTVKSLTKQLNDVKTKMNTMLPVQATIESDEKDIDVASKEYLDIQDKYNQAKVSTITPVQLRQLQTAMPVKVKSSAKIILIALSGITSFVFYLVILLIIFYMDTSIHSGEELVKLTHMSVLGFLNAVPSGSKRTEEARAKNQVRIYRDALRSIRFEIDREMNGSKVLAVTSLDKEEGKTLFSFGLAYAYSLANKKVLIIDGNFSNPVISQTLKTEGYIEDVFKSDRFVEFRKNEDKPVTTTTELAESTEKEIHPARISNNTGVSGISKTIQLLNDHLEENQSAQKGSINILGNRGGDVSLLEIADEKSIQEKMNELKKRFDIIIIEAGALNALNKSKEWIVSADKVVAVFEKDRAIDASGLSGVNYLRNMNGKMLGWIFNKA